MLSTAVLLAVLRTPIEDRAASLAVGLEVLISDAGAAEAVELTAGIAGNEPHRRTLPPATTVEAAVEAVYGLFSSARSEIPIPTDCPF